jgi:hypothetical protein
MRIRDRCRHFAAPLRLHFASGVAFFAPGNQNNTMLYCDFGCQVAHITTRLNKLTTTHGQRFRSRSSGNLATSKSYYPHRASPSKFPFSSLCTVKSTLPIILRYSMSVIIGSDQQNSSTQGPAPQGDGRSASFGIWRHRRAVD